MISEWQPIWMSMTCHQISITFRVDHILGKNNPQNHRVAFIGFRSSKFKMYYSLHFCRYSSRLLRSINKMLQSDRAAGLTRLQPTSNGNSNEGKKNILFYTIFCCKWNALVHLICVCCVCSVNDSSFWWRHFAIYDLEARAFSHLLLRLRLFLCDFWRRFSVYVDTTLNEMCPIEMRCTNFEFLSFSGFVLNIFFRAVVHSFIHCAN